MNYQNFASFDNRPPYYGKPNEAYYDRGEGVPNITERNLTIQDIYRTPFLFIQEHRKNYKNMAPTVLKSIQKESPLSRIFFSERNILRIQKMIKKEIFKKTHGEFRLDTDQEQRDILIVMRAVYLEHGRFLPGQTIRQVKRLNRKVVSEVIPGMITEMRQWYGYLKEINKPLTPIPRPINANNKGRLALPSVTTVWGVD